MTQDMNLETRLLLSLEGDGRSVFTTGDAKDILGTGDSSVWHILHGLVRKNRIYRIERSRYMLVPAVAGTGRQWAEYPWVIVPRLIGTYYVGFCTAMNYWGMTEQIPYTVFVATPKRKRRLEHCGQRFEFVRLSEKKFFGFVEEKASRTALFNISSREKTIVDGLTHLEYCGGITEVIKAMWNARNEVDWETVLEMAKRVEISTVLKRLGYLLSVLEIEEGIAGRVAEMVKNTSRSHLDPRVSRRGIAVSKRYGLVTHMTRDELLDWMYH